ncbi:glycosyltransferase family 4 protein [Candidatus Dependentiae bacterium]|nr:glycosyltransferase family 4 protein [Candidatus Dependentiae bacterium]
MEHTYWDNVTNKKIAILGRYPPPLGGISIHIKRVIAKLRAQKNKVAFFETGQSLRFKFFFLYRLKLLFFLLWYRPHILFYHTVYLHKSLNELRFITRLKNLLGYTIVLVEHNCRYLYEKEIDFRVELNRVMQHVDEQIFIGNLTETSYKKNGIMRPKKWSVQSAFLPPDTTQEETILRTYPTQLFDFLNEHENILVVNAFKLCLMNDGRDLYGVDRCIKVLLRLRNENNAIGLVVALGEVGNANYFKELNKQIQQHGLHEHVYFLCGQKELWPLLKKVTLFIRPTLSDGDSVSVGEALFFGVPVVASNVCVRPQEVILYKAGDEGDLYAKIKQQLGNMYSQQAAGYSESDSISSQTN